MGSAAPPAACERIKARGRRRIQSDTSLPAAGREAEATGDDATQPAAARRVSAADGRLLRCVILDDAHGIAFVDAPCIWPPGARNASRSITRTGS
jgi:hypothetical protein